MRILGLLREGKTPSDQRAVLNPAQCRELMNHHPDWRIWVQPSSVRAIPDADYAEAGCQRAGVSWRRSSWLVMRGSRVRRSRR